MNILLDTHYVIWALLEPEKIKEAHRAILRDAHHRKYISAVSWWEISLKFSLGKLELQGLKPEDLYVESQRVNFHSLYIDFDEVVSYHRLPQSINHKDPFDRMLIWQCLKHRMAFMSKDSRVTEYEAFGLMRV